MKKRKKLIIFLAALAAVLVIVAVAVLISAMNNRFAEQAESGELPEEPFFTDAVENDETASPIQNSTDGSTQPDGQQESLLPDVQNPSGMNTDSGVSGEATGNSVNGTSNVDTGTNDSVTTGVDANPSIPENDSAHTGSEGDTSEQPVNPDQSSLQELPGENWT